MELFVELESYIGPLLRHHLGYINPYEQPQSGRVLHK